MNRMTLCTALILLTPALAAAQDPVPAPPKQETVIIRTIDGKIELKGTSSADLFGFNEQCESKPGAAESSVLLSVLLEIEAAPNDSLEDATTILRGLVGRQASVEPSSERGQLAMFSWGGKPKFEGVVESLNVKYTMFMPDGSPARATVNLRMKQAGRLMNKEDAKEANKPGEKKKSDCSPSQR